MGTQKPHWLPGRCAWLHPPTGARFGGRGCCSGRRPSTALTGVVTSWAPDRKPRKAGTWVWRLRVPHHPSARQQWCSMTMCEQKNDTEAHFKIPMERNQCRLSCSEELIWPKSDTGKVSQWLLGKAKWLPTGQPDWRSQVEWCHKATDRHVT